MTHVREPTTSFVFHVKHHEQVRNTETRPLPSSRRETPKPARTVALQRSPAGGSLMITRPPLHTKREASVKVSTGGPKPRATAASIIGATSMKSSTSAHTTETRGDQPNRRTIRSRKSVRFARRSMSITSRSGRSCAITSPGIPPPDPRSMTVPDISSNAVTKARACSITSSMSRSPRNPRRLLSSSTVRTSSANTWTVCHVGIIRPRKRPQPGRTSGRAVERQSVNAGISQLRRALRRCDGSDRRLRSDSRHRLRH